MESAPMNVRGFSLIELLVVLFVIGLLIGTVSLSVNVGSDPQERLEEEAQRLLEYARLAGDRAILTGEPMGLVLLPPQASDEVEATWSYQWQSYRQGQWMPAEEPLAARDLPDNLELSLEVEGQQVNLAAQLPGEGFAAQRDQRQLNQTQRNQRQAAGRQSGQLEQGEPAAPLPSIVFYPGGEITPFRLTVFDEEAVDQQRVLTSERTGAVENLDPEEALLPPMGQTSRGLR